SLRANLKKVDRRDRSRGAEVLNVRRVGDAVGERADDLPAGSQLAAAANGIGVEELIADGEAPLADGVVAPRLPVVVTGEADEAAFLREDAVERSARDRRA